MDRYERMRSGDWPREDPASSFPRMPKRSRLTKSQGEWIEDAGRVALALTLLALLAAFVH